MPPAKSLLQLVHDRTFRSRRHHELLADRVLPYPELATIQAGYLAAENELERRAIGVQFERAMRVGAGAPGTRPDGILEAILNMPPEPYDREKDRLAAERFARALRARDLSREGVSLRDVAERIGVAVSTVRRYLRELEQLQPSSPR